MKTRLMLPAAFVCLGLAVQSSGAQKVPDRPRLPKTADTNDANAYYSWGLQQVEKQPEDAAAAFYWATRLDPAMADAFYARRVALLLEDRRRLLKYWQGDEGTIRSDDIRRIDSLYYHALTLNPFVPARLEHVIFDAVLDQISENLGRQTGDSPGEIRFELEHYMFDAPPELRAYQAHAEGRLQDALTLYASAIDAAHFKATLRVDRATVFYEAGQLDSALAELTAAATEMKKRDNKDLVYVYDSKALLDERIAVTYLRLGKLDSAREALGQALQEDLSYSPAHVYLAYLAMARQDTATTMSEMDLAVQLRPDDPAMQYAYGVVLMNAGRLDDAAPHFRAAIARDSVYAAPYFSLAQVLDKRGRAADAAGEYSAYLTVAPRSGTQRDEAQARLKALQPGGGPTPEPRP
ncbi:MAG: tetratricopeptide repeat protein [Gemmatimonadaceae bacterium]